MESTKKANKEEIKNEELVQRWMEVPTQATQVMVETSKKMQEVSMDYFRQLEKIQRDHFQHMAQVWNTVLPGESRIWDAQIKMMESGFEMFDRMMATAKKA